MTTDAPALRSTERLLELAEEASATVAQMQEDCGDFIRKGHSLAAEHYKSVIQKQTDIATALRALVKVRELAAQRKARGHSLRVTAAQRAGAEARLLNTAALENEQISAELTAILVADGGAT